MWFIEESKTLSGNRKDLTEYKKRLKSLDCAQFFKFNESRGVETTLIEKDYLAQYKNLAFANLGVKVDADPKFEGQISSDCWPK